MRLNKRRARVDLVGKMFGSLIVRQMLPRQSCICDCTSCGRQNLVKNYCHLESGAIQSCGCLTASLISKRMTRHGHSRRSGESAEYRIWCGMVQRCTNPNLKYYKDYGGRGIYIDPRWLKFENFLEDMGTRPTGKHQLDRFPENDGPYTKSNCRWATSKENNNNRRSCRMITAFGKTQTTTQWAEEYGIDDKKFRRRLDSGWPVLRALSPEDGRSTRWQ